LIYNSNQFATFILEGGISHVSKKCQSKSVIVKMSNIINENSVEFQFLRDLDNSNINVQQPTEEKVQPDIQYEVQQSESEQYENRDDYKGSREERNFGNNEYWILTTRSSRNALRIWFHMSLITDLNSINISNTKVRNALKRFIGKNLSIKNIGQNETYTLSKLRLDIQNIVKKYRIRGSKKYNEIAKEIGSLVIKISEKYKGVNDLLVKLKLKENDVFGYDSKKNMYSLNQAEMNELITIMKNNRAITTPIKKYAEYEKTQAMKGYLPRVSPEGEFNTNIKNIRVNEESIKKKIEIFFNNNDNRYYSFEISLNLGDQFRNYQVKNLNDDREKREKMFNVIMEIKNLATKMRLVNIKGKMTRLLSFIRTSSLSGNTTTWNLLKFMPNVSQGNLERWSKSSDFNMVKIFTSKIPYNISILFELPRETIFRIGKFWPYFHNIPEIKKELKALQMYTKDIFEIKAGQFPTSKPEIEILDYDIEIPCLMYVFKSLGISEDKLKQVKEMMIGKKMTNKKIRDLTEKLKINLVLHSEYKKDHRFDRCKEWKKYEFMYGDEKDKVYEILETEDHYMRYMKFDTISKDYLLYYHSKDKVICKNEVIDRYSKNKNVIKCDDLSCVNLNFIKNGKRVMMNIDKRADTKDIIKFLFSNEKNQELITPYYVNKIESINVNDDKFYDNLSIEGFMSRKIRKKAEQEYVWELMRCKKINDENEREFELKKLKNVTFVSKNGNKYLMKEVLSEHKKFYNIDTKFETTYEERINFLRNHKNKVNEYIPSVITYKDEQYDLYNYSNSKNVYTKKYKVIYADIECGFKNEDSENQLHVPYCICYIDEDDNKYKFAGRNCIKDFFDSLKESTLIYFHNLKYDIQFIMRHLTNIKCTDYDKGRKKNMNCNILISDGVYYSASGCYVNKKEKTIINVKIKDSFKLLPISLASFPSVFKLEGKKEICPYNLYMINDEYDENDEESKFMNEYESLKNALACLKKDDHKEFIEKSKPYIDEKNRFDYIRYSIDYCIQDCNLLKKGVEMFREWMYGITLEDLHDSLTLPSIANKYLIESGVYEGCYKLSNVPRHFIQRCVAGGRVMVKNNERQISENEPINDFDAVSLYPSGMNRIAEIGGFLLGIPKILNENEKTYDFIKNKDGYFVKVNVKKTNKKLYFPLSSVINNDGIREYKNLENDIIYLDKIGLEELIEHQEIEFEILDGLYYKSGRNNKIGEIIKGLFNERNKYKKEGNPIEYVFKLIMNSSYGKTIEKAKDIEIKIIHDDDINQYINKKYNSINNIEHIKNSYLNIVKLEKSINDHFSLPNIGCEILSMSKRIMNEVMVLAEENNISIFYTDTDSIHITDKHIPLLQQKFKEKYGRELIGKELGQFHSDFSPSNKKDAEIYNALYATKSIFLAKKIYIDELLLKKKDPSKIKDEYKDYYNSQPETKKDYHVRMKGITTSSILFKAEEDNVTPYNIYKMLYENSKTYDSLTEEQKKDKDFINDLKIDFDLAAAKARFEFIKGMGVIKKNKFVRSILIKNKQKPCK